MELCPRKSKKNDDDDLVWFGVGGGGKKDWGLDVPWTMARARSRRALRHRLRRFQNLRSFHSPCPQLPPFPNPDIGIAFNTPMGLL